MLQHGEGDCEADERDAKEGVDARAGRRAVGGLLAVVKREDAAAVGPGPEDADALDGPGVEEGVADVAHHDGGVKVGEPGPQEGQGEHGDGPLRRVAMRDGPVPEAALDASRDRREDAADGAPERVDVGGRRRGRRDHDAGRRPGDLEKSGRHGVPEHASGDVGA